VEKARDDAIEVLMQLILAWMDGHPKTTERF
jgi:hypothetical protein